MFFTSRTVTLRAAIVAMILVVMAALAGAAFSQTAATTNTTGGVNPTPIIVALINLAFPAVAAVATYLINAHVKNQQMANMLSNAVQNGLGVVQQRTTAALNGSDITVQVGNPNIQSGVQYVIDNAAEAIRHFNIPTDRIAQKLEAKLGLAEIATNLATTASPMPVIAGPLAPAPEGRILVPA